MSRYSKLIGFVILLLVGCGDGTSGKVTATGKADQIEGIVADRDGPVTHGNIVVKDNKGATLAIVALNGEARFVVNIPAHAAYPLLLAIPAHDEVLEAVVMDASVVKQDITHMSSLVVRTAREMGGFTKQNMARAAIGAIAQSQTSSGTKTSAGFSGDPTKQYGGWH
jgi:hypothetical protein